MLAWESASFPKAKRTTGNPDRKSTRLNSSHSQISYAVFCLKKKKKLNNRFGLVSVDKVSMCYILLRACICCNFFSCTMCLLFLRCLLYTSVNLFSKVVYLNQ